MLFSSIPFLYYFLPIVVTLYAIAPKFLKNTVLLIASLVFYAWGEPKYVFLMIATVSVGYVLGILIEKFRGRRLSKVFMTLSVVSSLAALGYFKYADFFIANFNRITGLSIPLLRLVLPIGISFYTFQILSYTIDVYRGTVAAQKNPINLATYVALFPQLIAGPIVRYSDISRQLTERTHSFEKTAHGIRRFIIGLSKKIILANSLGELCDAFMQSGDKSVAFFWLFAVCYSLQIYFDFSGYSDMAIGLGKLFGFEFMENFNYPFISKSITDFWRRWHISLGSWFRDYVYIPLGGNRVKKPRLLFNIFIVWFLTGFWHGAEWNFIIWGLYFGILLTVEKFYLSDFLKKHKFFSHIYLVFFVAISFVIFSANNLSQAISYVGGMFGIGGVPLVSAEWLYYLKSYGVIALVAAVASTPLPKKMFGYLYKNKSVAKTLDLLEIPALLLLLLISTAYLADGSFNPFLYFRF
ncbi:MAG: MBOAT family O-acyltransferase [Clostridia bacterium]|nr:MBOAT family O-acyltransferase [Clostridia bacterium]